MVIIITLRLSWQRSSQPSPWLSCSSFEYVKPLCQLSMFTILLVCWLIHYYTDRDHHENYNHSECLQTFQSFGSSSRSSGWSGPESFIIMIMIYADHCDHDDENELIMMIWTRILYHYDTWCWPLCLWWWQWADYDDNYIYLAQLMLLIEQRLCFAT